jgi:arylsulfatase A-like enzyme
VNASASWRAAAALGSLLLGCAIGCGAPGERPHILLVTLDTTRADHLGVYGHHRATSPSLDALAGEATVYTNARSTSSWTLPAHASLFTGRFPSSHGARYDTEGEHLLADSIEAPGGIRARGLAPGQDTLAEVLGRAGYATAAVVAGPWLLRTFGLARGFEHYDDAGILDYAGRPADDVTDAALRWLEARDERPFFLFLNYFDPHFPYAPPPPHDRAFLPPGTAPDPARRAQFGALYDAEIRFADRELGRLIRGLRERGDYERTLVVVTSDHGELLGEHGEWGHGRFLFEELVRVPLLVKPAGPSRLGRSEARPVQLLDLFPLLLESAGVPGPADIQGRAPPLVGHPLLAEVNPIASADPARRWRALWRGKDKLMQNDAAGRLLFDLESDPREQVDLAGREPSLGAQLSQDLERAFAALPTPPPAAAAAEIDARTRDALERLGYLE